jgi:hypothetical protein
METPVSNTEHVADGGRPRTADTGAVRTQELEQSRSGAERSGGEDQVVRLGAGHRAGQAREVVEQLRVWSSVVKTAARVAIHCSTQQAAPCPLQHQDPSTWRQGHLRIANETLAKLALNA